MEYIGFLCHVRSDGDLKLFFLAWMLLYCAIHLGWDIKLNGLSLAAWGGKLNMVANAATFTTGILLFQIAIFSDVLTLVGNGALWLPLIMAAIASLLSGFAGLPAEIRKP